MHQSGIVHLVVVEDVSVTARVWQLHLSHPRREMRADARHAAARGAHSLIFARASHHRTVTLRVADCALPHSEHSTFLPATRLHCPSFFRSARPSRALCSRSLPLSLCRALFFFFFFPFGFHA